MDNKNKDEKESEWIDAKDDFIVKRDEKLVLLVYRFIRTYYQFFLGLVFGVLLMGLIFK